MALDMTRAASAAMAVGQVAHRVLDMALAALARVRAMAVGPRTHTARAVQRWATTAKYP
jgi:hypothetical protein